MFKNFSEDDYNIMKAAHQYMVYAYNEVDMKIDESVYQDKSIDANKSESKSERENLEGRNFSLPNTYHRNKEQNY